MPVFSDCEILLSSDHKIGSTLCLSGVNTAD